MVREKIPVHTNRAKRRSKPENRRSSRNVTTLGEFRFVFNCTTMDAQVSNLSDKNVTTLS
jgi:hypothetical protein